MLENLFIFKQPHQKVHFYLLVPALKPPSISLYPKSTQYNANMKSSQVLVQIGTLAPPLLFWWLSLLLKALQNHYWILDWKHWTRHSIISLPQVSALAKVTLSQLHPLTLIMIQQAPHKPLHLLCPPYNIFFSKDPLCRCSVPQISQVPFALPWNPQPLSIFQVPGISRRK